MSGRSIRRCGRRARAAAAGGAAHRGGLRDHRHRLHPLQRRRPLPRVHRRGDAAAARVACRRPRGGRSSLVTAVILYFWIRRTFTAVRASAEARRDTERRTQLLVERVRDYAIFTLDAGRQRHELEPRGAADHRLAGGGDRSGKHVSVFYPPADVARGQAAARPGGGGGARVDRGGGRARAAGRQPSSGSTRASHGAARRRRQASSGFLCLWRDVTERRRAQEALRAGEPGALRRSSKRRRCRSSRIDRDERVTRLEPGGGAAVRLDGRRSDRPAAARRPGVGAAPTSRCTSSSSNRRATPMQGDRSRPPAQGRAR